VATGLSALPSSRDEIAIRSSQSEPLGTRECHCLEQHDAQKKGEATIEAHQPGDK